MADLRIVAKAMNDLADDWHWVVLTDAEAVGPEVYLAGSVRTLCGIPISDAPRRVRLFDMGAPDAPTCPRCLDGGVSPGLRAQVEAALEAGESVPAPAPVSTPISTPMAVPRARVRRGDRPPNITVGAARLAVSRQR